jgi:hypothetical protein
LAVDDEIEQPVWPHASEAPTIARRAEGMRVSFAFVKRDLAHAGPRRAPSSLA